VPLDDATVIDVLIKDDLALLGGSKQVTVVSIADPTRPRVLGTMAGVGGRLAIAENNILFSTAHSVFGGNNDPLGGVKTATLGKITIISDINANPVVVALDGNSIEPQVVRYRSIPMPGVLQTSELEVLRNGQAYKTLPAPLDSRGEGQLTLPVGTLY